MREDALKKATQMLSPLANAWSTWMLVSVDSGEEARRGTYAGEFAECVIVAFEALRGRSAMVRFVREETTHHERKRGRASFGPFRGVGAGSSSQSEGIFVVPSLSLNFHSELWAQVEDDVEGLVAHCLVGC